MDRTQQPESATRPGNTVVLSIDCLKGSSKSEEWSGDMLQTGDIVEEIRIGSGPDSAIFKAPFKGGKVWLQKVLHNSYRNKETSIVVRVRRGSDDLSDLSACIVPNESAGKRLYMAPAIVGFDLWIFGFPLFLLSFGLMGALASGCLSKRKEILILGLLLVSMKIDLKLLLEFETQKIIQGQRESGTSVDGDSGHNTDILRIRADPNALKEHLLKFTADHLADLAAKRGSVSTCGEDIGG